MRRAVFVVIAGIFLSPTPARAADETVPAPAVSTTRPALLLPLYAGNIAVQAFDVYSTLEAVRAGGVEQNVVISGLVRSPGAFIAVKAGVTVASIIAAERLWRSGRRAEAIFTIAVANGVMTAVAINNANVMRRMR
jgi:hypothetical protein